MILMPLLALALARPATARSTPDVPPPAGGSTSSSCPTHSTEGRRDFRHGVIAIYSFTGEIAEQDFADNLVTTLRQDHVGILNLEINGINTVVVDDSTPLLSREKFVERATLICRIEALAKGAMVHIQFFPLQKTHPETPAAAQRREALEAQEKLDRERGDLEAAQRLPDRGLYTYIGPSPIPMK